MRGQNGPPSDFFRESSKYPADWLWMAFRSLSLEVAPSAVAGAARPVLRPLWPGYRRSTSIVSRTGPPRGRIHHDPRKPPRIHLD